MSQDNDIDLRVYSDGNDERKETVVDYSNFNVMGPWYFDIDHFRGKPQITTKKCKHIQARVVGDNGVLFDHTVGMRLYNVESRELLLVDAEEAFKYRAYCICSYMWKHDRIEQTK
jgi:hypothetical protein